MDADLAAALPFIPALPFSDIEEARRVFDELLAGVPPLDTTGLTVEDRRVPGPEGGPEVAVRLFTPEGGGTSRPGVLDIHGGGFAIGTPALDDAVNASIAREVGAVVVSVDYRLAPEHPFPAPAEDCYAALVWFARHAGELGVDPGRIAVLGDSAGGGLAATTALLARDRGGPALAMQVLIEPELDDRLETHSMRTGTETPVWHRANAVESWRYYLGGTEPSPYSAPARMEDLSGLPPTYLTVNELDPLRDEGLEYARRLLVAGVSTELHCWPGAFHGFVLVADAPITRRALDAMRAALRRGLGVDEHAATVQPTEPSITGVAEAATGV